jgi:hypothetical protein
MKNHNASIYIPKNCPLPYRTDPRGQAAEKGTPFLIENFSGTPLSPRPAKGAYFVNLLFFYSLWREFGEEPFHRWNLDAARVSYLMGEEVIELCDPDAPGALTSYDALLKINADHARAVFPPVFAD